MSIYNPGTAKQVPDHSFFDNNNKQVYLGNQYIYTVNATVGTTETPVLLFNNPIGGGFPGNVKSIFQNLRRISTVTAATTAILKIYINPTVTSNGTLVTPLNLRPSSLNTSISTIYTAPTVSANGTYVSSLPGVAFSPSTSTLLAILDPGVSVLGTITASAASTPCIAELSWYEI